MSGVMGRDAIAIVALTLSVHAAEMAGQDGRLAIRPVSPIRSTVMADIAALDDALATLRRYAAAQRWPRRWWTRRAVRRLVAARWRVLEAFIEAAYEHGGVRHSHAIPCSAISAALVGASDALVDAAALVWRG